MRKVATCIIISILVLCLLSCSKYSGKYQEVQPMLNYICDNSQLEISKIDVLWREDDELINYSADVSFVIEVSYSDSRIPIEYIDELRIIANDYLSKNKDFFLNDGYSMYFVVKNPYRDYGDWTYAAFANFEYKNEENQFDGLYFFDCLIYEEDFDYIASLKDIVQIKIRPTEHVGNYEYVEGVMTSLQSNNTIQSIVLPEQYGDFEKEFPNNIKVEYYN